MTRESGIGNREFDVSDDNVSPGFAEDAPDKIIDHRDLDIWKTSMSPAGAVYRLTKCLPSDERFSLISQMRRAAVSIPANIAEGYGWQTSGSYLQFLRISQGSARELETLIELAGQLDYLKAAERDPVIATVTRVAMMLRRLIQAIERRKGK